MHARLALLVAALVALAPAAEGAGPAAPTRATMKVLRRVVLDPGHGGENTGCMGFHGVFEKYLTLQIAERTEQRLRARSDAEVFLTRRRDEDFGLRERTNYASAVEGDVFVSIHLNASLGGTAHGIETYFLSASAATDEIEELIKREEEATGPVPLGVSPDEVHKAAIDAILFDAQLGAAHQISEQLAATIQRHLTRAIAPAPDRGVKQAPFAVLKEATVPAVVVECGFLTNEGEGTAMLLEEHQDRIADALASALMELDAALAPPDSH